MPKIPIVPAYKFYQRSAKNLTPVRPIKILPFLLVGILSLISIAQASAPAGPPPSDGKEAFAKAEVVFTGKVISVEKDALGFDSLANVEVTKIWKGQKLLKANVRISGQGGPTYPARIFEKGREYLFYLSSSLPDVFHADSYMNRVLCLDDKAAEAEVRADLSFLDALPSTKP